jgi:Flp pilus assembly protein TadD
VQTRFDLGRAYALQGNADLAIETLKRVIVEDPNSGEAHNLLARVYSQKGWKEAAQAEVLEAQRLGFREPSR